MDEVTRDQATKASLRIHDIDWDAKNIPISRDDIDWVDEVYWGNPDEYPLMQFHISKALGRVVGFLDERQRFNVVLLDPKHNLQPSKFANYRIRSTTIGQCEYTGLLAHAASCIHSAPGLSPEMKSALIDRIHGKVNVDWQQIMMLPLGLNEVSEINAAIAMSEVDSAPEYILNLILNSL